MWPKQNMGLSNTGMPKMPTMGNANPIKKVPIPAGIKAPLPSEEPVMHMMPQHMNTNPMVERGRMFNNLKSFLNKNKIGGAI